MIFFNFEDQKDFSSQKEITTNFDCEAFIYLDKKIHIFSKRWGDLKTYHYVLDLEDKSKYIIAKKIEEFDTGSAITSACLYDGELFLTGYDKRGAVYLYKFSNFDGYKFFSGKIKKTFLGLSPLISQIEGISVTEDKIFISGEQMYYPEYFINVKPYLYILEKNQIN